jgi:hypothetical protein
MRTLSSELGPLAEQFSSEPRIYADANVPAGLVAFMRDRLHWDVLFVLEHDDLRRAPDVEHFRLARQLRRTLVTLDRDYLDDRRFPLADCAGVLVVSGPDERLLARLLSRLDRAFFRPRSRRTRTRSRSRGPAGLPLEGRKLHVHPDWVGGQASP